MPAILRRISALLVIASYLTAVFAGVAHFEHHHHAAPVLEDRAVTTESAEDNHHQCSCKLHEHGQSSPGGCETEIDGQDRSPACPHDHGDNDCPICQSLAEKPISGTAVTIVNAAEPVVEWPEDPVIAPETPLVASPVSRGPPVLG